MNWFDLSDDELQARLAQRRPTVSNDAVERLVDQREDPIVRSIIDDWLDG